MGHLKSLLFMVLHLYYTNADVFKYEMLIAEDPVKIVQVVTFDEDAGLRFVEVPKHRHLMKTLHVTDLNDDRLTLQVVEEMEACFIGKPRHHLGHKEEKEALANFTQQFDNHKMFSSNQAVHEELIFLPGAHIAHDELPTKLQQFCPSNYRVQTFRYIDRNNQVVSVSPSGDMIIQDPEIQRDYKNGDFLMTEEDIMPEGLLSVSHRVKRGPRCLAMDSSGQLIGSGCMWVSLSCKGNGCPGTHVYYTCRNNNVPGQTGFRGCEYILLCSTMNNARCAVHSESTAVRCEQCCISDDCGTHMPKCSSSNGGVNTSTRKLTMKINMKKESPSIDYENEGAHVSITYNGEATSTGILPATLPDAGETQTVKAETMGVLGTCWGHNISGGNPDTMKIKLKLPQNSPISVSKVVVIDDDALRCWTARWKGGNNNKQNGKWIEGTNLYFDDDCTK